MRVLDLFSGIGGFSLGLERAGMRTVAFCESDPYCRRVLARHWPEVPCYHDIRTLTAARLAADGIVPDLICGGFPCQDISVAGDGAGLAGPRSGLWREMARLTGELRPGYVLVENVAALLGRGMGEVLGDLSALGYDAEWQVISAADMGAPHLRERVWIVAYPTGIGRVAHEPQSFSGSVAACPQRSGQSAGNGAVLAHPDDQGELQPGGAVSEERRRAGNGSWPECDLWRVEPDVGRVAHGIPHRMDRLRALGNSLVPQIPEMIGRAIMEQEAGR